MFARLIASFCFALLASPAFATASADDMSERYEDAQRCMERAIGKQWHEKYGIELARNRWGAVEPTAHAIDTAPQVVRLTDMRCRRELSLAGEPRP